MAIMPRAYSRPNMTDLSLLSSLNRRARDLADRWVLVLHPGYPKGYVYSTNVKIDPEAKLIRFGIYFVDGVQISFDAHTESISTRYLDDDSTLEVDAKTWKAAEDARQSAVRARIEALKARPEVTEYLSLATHQSQRWAYPQGYGYGGMPMYPTHELLKETPKP